MNDKPIALPGIDHKWSASVTMYKDLELSQLQQTCRQAKLEDYPVGIRQTQTRFQLAPGLLAAAREKSSLL